MPIPIPLAAPGAGARRFLKMLLAVACVLAVALWVGGAEAATNSPVTTAGVQRTSFDHLTTGFELLGQHRDLPCESCHVNAIFKGTPKDCAACHGLGTQVRATAKPANHILTSDACESCHTPVAWNPAVNFDHTQVRGSCSSCHNNVQTQGMGPMHISTTLECDACHTTISWAGATFNHIGVSSGCSSCHNGSGATGPPANHVPIGPVAAAACEGCHSIGNFTTWVMPNQTGAAPPAMVHTADSVFDATTGCSQCHEAGLSWAGAPPTKLRPALKTNGQPHAATGECSNCHFNTTSFLGATDVPANHIPLPAADAANCSLCHSNPADYTTATMNHVNISNNCAQCHAAGLSFMNMAPPKLVEPPGNHIPFGATACESCHLSTSTAVGGFKFTNASGSAPAAMVHTAVAGTACATCHAAGMSWAGVPATVTTPANHVPIGSAACDGCHLGSSTATGGFKFANAPATAPPAMVHAAVAGAACAVCHATGSNWAGTPATVLPPANHIPFGAAPCEGCHLASSQAIGGFKFANATGTTPPAMVHTQVSSSVCSACHEAGLSWAGVPPTVLRPAVVPITLVPHVATGECSTCHFSTVSFLGATNYPANHIPLPNGGSSTCTTCHSNASDYSVYTMVHTVVAGSACATCHASGMNFVNMAPPKLMEPPSNHVPIGSAPCESCHLASSTATGGFKFTNASGTVPAAMVHAAVGGTACATCHGVGLSWVGTPATVIPPANHVPIGSVACESCHLAANTATGGFKLPSNISGTSPPSMVHAAVSGVACATCHAAGLSWIGTPATVLPPANHIPIGTAACESCHLSSSTAVGGFKFTNASGTVPAAMVHTAVSGVACATCHATGKTWAGIPATLTPPANHIPFGTAACEGCHLASSTATGGFKFANATGTTPPSMVHTLVASIVCSTCHEKGLTWAGAPPTVLRPVYEVGSSGALHVTGGECSTCHFSTVSFLGASDLPANHIPVPAADNNNCSLCHSNLSDYTTATMNHVNISSNCAQCHAAGLSFVNMAPPTLVEPPANHVPFGSAACESCHLNTSTATGGFKFTNASGTVPAAMVHAAVSGVACATCHATGKTWAGTPATLTPPGNHIPYGSAACESCHLASSTATGGFKFANLTGTVPPAMVHTVVSAACSTCHEKGLSWAGTPATLLRPIYEVGSSGVLHVTTGECSVCHFNTVSFLGATDFPANHIPMPAADNNNCVLCHTGPDYTTATMNHINISSNCAQCHAAGLSFANIAPPALVETPANHIPFGSAACESCHLNTSTAVGGFKFTNASGTVPAAMVHAAVSGTACATCHATGKSWAGTPSTVLPPANHIPFGSAACESCHLASSTATGGFKFTNQSGTAPAAMVHAAVSGVACATCHASGLTWAGTPATVLPPANHIPFGSAACESCHLASSTAAGGFKFSNVSATTPAAMVHAAVSGVACATCHAAGLTWAGTPATVVLPSNHVPVGSAACEGCHLASSTAVGGFKFSNLTGTVPPAMVHSLVSSTACSTCHEKGLSWAGTPATVLRPIYEVGSSGTLHVTTGECSGCHFSTVSFLGAVDFPPNHIPLPLGTSSPCATCHTTGNFAAYVMGATGHAVVNGTACAVCHAYGLSFAGVWTTPLTAPPSGATGHIPSNAPNGTLAIACEACHSKTVFTNFAGTKMLHAQVTTMLCTACHETGMKWKTNTGVKLWVRPSGHHGTQQCNGSGCHSTRDKFAPRPAASRAPATAAASASASASAAKAIGPAGLRPTPAGGVARIISGGSGVSPGVASVAPPAAPALPAGHLPTTTNCMSCHTTLGWTPVAQVDHTQVRGSCVSCHNGVLATAKGRNHIASGVDCVTCHTTNAWTPARFEHTAVATGTCISCHDGLHAAGKPANHVPTQAQCDTCHGTLGWTPAKLDHTRLTAQCAACHNNSTALGLPVGHLGTSIDCATCHSYPDWTVLRFVHDTANYPGTHKAALTCVACHTANTDKISWTSPAAVGTCAGCHAKDFVPAAHPKISRGLNYMATELRNCTGACHVYGDATQGTVVKSLPGPYHRVSDAAFKH